MFWAVLLFIKQGIGFMQVLILPGSTFLLLAGFLSQLLLQHGLLSLSSILKKNLLSRKNFMKGELMIRILSDLNIKQWMA